MKTPTFLTMCLLVALLVLGWSEGKPMRKRGNKKSHPRYRALKPGKKDLGKREQIMLIHAPEFKQPDCSQPHIEVRCPPQDVITPGKCIKEERLCDGNVDCEGGADEDGTMCMFHKNAMAYVRILSNLIQEKNLHAGNGRRHL